MLNVEIEDCDKVINATIEDGVKGDKGLSAYQVAVQEGFVGTIDEWLESLVGPPVPVAQELGDDPDLAVSQKLLKDSIDSMEQSNSEAVAEAERLNNLSQQAASSAAESELNASASAESASSSALSADQSASESEASAEQSLQSASSSESSAQSAASSAQSASESASSAGVSAEQASLAAVAADDSASKAKQSELSAIGSAERSEAGANSASSSATQAEQSAQSAASNAQSATDSADLAAEKAAETEFNAERVEALIKSVETQTGGRMTVRFTPKGQPSYFYVLPQFNCEDIAPDGSLGSGPHPAFIFDGKVEPYILIAAYQAAMVDGEVVSQPNLDPHTNITYDQALSACRENGAGWDLMSNLDWAAVALWCMAYGNQPYGNTYYGLAHDKRFLTGIRQDKLAAGTASETARTLTGTGGAHWNHNGLDCGIADMVGNVWEWVSGMKMVDGRVLLATENGVTDESSYIDTGFDLPASRTWSAVDNEGASELVKQSLIAPATAGLAPKGSLYKNLEGERLPCRGGLWYSVGGAGLAALFLNSARSSRTASLGFRARFRDL